MYIKKYHIYIYIYIITRGKSIHVYKRIYMYIYCFHFPFYRSLLKHPSSFCQHLFHHPKVQMKVYLNRNVLTLTSLLINSSLSDYFAFLSFSYVYICMYIYIYILSSTERLFRCIIILQCGETL